MAQVGFKGVDNMMRKLDKHKLLVLGSIAATKRQVVTAVMVDLVKNSPQWSGNLASQWYVEFHGHKGSYRPIPDYVEPHSWRYTDDHYSMGDDPAVSQTIAREKAKIENIRWNSKVQIINYAPYASDVEAGFGPEGFSGQPRPIRPENILASYGKVAMAAYVTTKYNNLRYLRRAAK